MFFCSDFKVLPVNSISYANYMTLCFRQNVMNIELTKRCHTLLCINTRCP